ncbi:MAG: polysaccharide deacetylase family protein [Acidobacteria bacterium]|nr:MAG: polysaccharide deacetylase family protein [Acidobacteriota bacterium]
MPAIGPKQAGRQRWKVRSAAVIRQPRRSLGWRAALLALSSPNCPLRAWRDGSHARRISTVNAWTFILPAVAGAGVSAWGAFHPRSQLFGPTVHWADNACALTFDDGPNPQVTTRLLSLLEKHEVPATFFVLGKYVREYPSLASEIVARKHCIGNHTYAHPSLLLLSRQRIIDELNRCEDAVFQATAVRTACVRPPFGFRGPQFYPAARRAGFSKIVMWSVNGWDWNPQPACRVSRRLEKVQQGDIVLLHDGDHRASNADRRHMLEALEYWLPRWKNRGLQFVSFG